MAIGHVYLVGAGPGDPELITVRGLRLVRTAEVILHDRLVCQELIEEAHPQALVLDVGKENGSGGASQERINEQILRYARAGKTVVRLKGGDPLVFGRGWEEAQACAAAGVPCTIVPGISSAIAVPALAGIPVTHRGIARSFAVVTGRTANEDPLNFPALAAMDTLVVLMGLAGLEDISAGLMDAGRDSSTPAACIEQGATQRQRIVTGTLGTLAGLARENGLKSPVVTVIGEVARFARQVRLIAANHVPREGDKAATA